MLNICTIAAKYNMNCAKKQQKCRNLLEMTPVSVTNQRLTGREGILRVIFLVYFRHIFFIMFR